MKSDLSKLKSNKILYIISITFSIYFAYLMYNAYSIGGKISLIIALILSAISSFLIFLFNRNIDVKKIEKKTLKIIFGISIVLSIVILVFNFNFLTKNFKKSQVKIVALQEKNEHSLGNKITIKNIVQANKVINLSTSKINKDWEYANKKISSKDGKYGEQILSFKKSDRIKIVFEKNEKAGKVKIIDGNYEEVVDLYSYKSGLYNYEVKSNSNVDGIFIIRIISSLAMILFITTSLLIASYYLYKIRKSIILPTLILIFVLRGFYYSNMQAYTLYPDSTSYIEYNFSELLKLKIPARTPVYPFVIGFCNLVFGQKLFLEFVVLFQILVSFIAVIYFYKLLKLIIRNEKVVALITLIYGVTEAICGWDNCILTESLALSEYVFFIYNVIKYIQKAKLRNGFMAVLISIVLTFLRPTSIILTAFLFAFWIGRFIFDRKEIKTDFKCFIGSVICLIVIVIYSIIFNQTHQIYSISDPTIRQNLFICIDQGFYKASNDKQFIEDVEKEEQRVEKETNLTGNSKIWEIERYIQKKYGNEKVQELTAYCTKKMIPQYIEYLIKLMKDYSRTQYEGYSVEIPNYDSVIYDIQVFVSKIVNFAYVYFMIIAELIITIYKWIKRKQVPWVHIGIFGFSIAIMLSSFIGTNSEYMRTSLGVVPFFYMSFAMLLDYILLSTQNKMIKNLK